MLGVVLVAVLACTPFRPLKVTGHSMEPTLRNGETYLLDSLYWKSDGLRRMDVVVVNHAGEKWVKRLVGMPGDVLQIETRDDGWITSISNLTTDPSQRRDTPFTDTRTVGAGEIFVIGDNLNRSFDSTRPEAGAFRLDDVIGVVRTPSMRRDFPYRQHL